MPREHFELTTFVDVDVDTAFQFLSDLNNHRHLHPYFVQAELIHSETDAVGCQIKDFMITERPRFGPFRYTIKFPTKLIFTGQHEFTSEVRAAFNTNLTNIMQCKAEPHGTRITESVLIDAPWLTISYVKQQAFIAHKRTFDFLPSVLKK